MDEKQPSGLLNSGKELRQLILDNPDLPLLVFAGDESNGGDYAFMSCSSVHACVGEILDCMQTINEERCYTDRSDFAEDVERNCDCNFEEKESFDELVERTIHEYDPYWKKCIIVRVDN